MSRVIPFMIALVAATPALAGEDYNLEINGKTYNLELNEPKEIVAPDGSTLALRLSLKEFLEFESLHFSFRHRNSFRPTREDLGDGIFQTILTTALGTAIIVQEYTTIDPSHLIDAVIHELTKEEIEYGYELEKTGIAKRIGDLDLQGSEAITTFKDEQWTRAVYAYGGKSEGLLIMTMIEKDNVDTDSPMIDDFWRTLQIRY